MSVRQVLKIGAAAQLESESVRQVLKIRAAAQLESKTDPREEKLVLWNT